MQGTVARAGSFGGMVADFCWPPACLVCGTSLQSAKTLICDECDAAVCPHGVVCRRCGSGMGPVAPGGGTPGGRTGGVCRDCREHEPTFVQARSYGPHVAPLSSMIYHLKYRHRPALGPFLAARLAAVLRAAEWDDVDAIVPVPTTWWRRWRRGYNQAEVLARELGVLTDLPVLPRVVMRRHGASQVGADYARRAQNVRGQFRVTRSRDLLHQRVLLVDDVLTTGATAQEVAATIMAAGARKVYLVTLTSTGRAQRRA
ncbi:ComF family protein [Candidatus Fermentibacteria bacterium]|nr:ComF family protein [Candidatus Fermentibacteria bacterium]